MAVRRRSDASRRNVDLAKEMSNSHYDFWTARGTV
jgi:hypothetical protein